MLSRLSASAAAAEMEIRPYSAADADDAPALGPPGIELPQELVGGPVHEMLNAPARPRSAPSTTTRERAPPPPKIQWSLASGAAGNVGDDVLHPLGIGSRRLDGLLGAARSVRLRSAP